ncbi:uncharacterized protein LOC118438251 [Folsomia candida]|uniref:uncharacterized protein LOC118438251 n=1 Tax=Folsomia candida TaxID=158441 RepID=UPI001604A98B|nr:uncharacterized protein LOC118438251 [Folsomia candida]XP_035714058.1 uncharacterized protein LOC118438251 [Folsomia candida]
MDNILEEDWSDFDSEFRANIEGCDKLGRPVLSVTIGDWDLRRAVVSGHSDRLARYFCKVFEAGSVLTRRFQKNEQRAVQASVIFDMGNFNLVQHGCARCLSICFHMFTVIEQHYPYFAHWVTYINTPEIAHPIYDILKPILSKHVTEILHIFGRNKKKWQKFLLEEIDESQLTKDLGGKNWEALDYVDIRGANTSMYTCANMDILRGYLA